MTALWQSHTYELGIRFWARARAQALAAITRTVGTDGEEQRWDLRTRSGGRRVQVITWDGDEFRTVHQD